MERIQKSQLAKILLLVLFLALLFSTPFVSSSMRSSYIYLLLNLLIIVLGVEAGFLSAVSKQQDERKLQASVVAVSPINDAQQPVTIATGRATSSTDIIRPEARPSMIMEKPPSAATAERVKSTLKRCKSRPSLFFIGSLEPDCGEEEEEVKEEEEAVVVPVKKKTAEEIGELSKQELFMKAEMFIGNFYKQLKMQRENSWQKLHDLYHHKAF